MDAVALLGRASLFQGFSPEDLEPLAASARVRTFPRGAFIFHEGDPGNVLFVIRSGQVKIARTGPGGEEVVFAILLPGDFFGEMALFDEDAVRTASAQAVELSECLTVSRESFTRFLDQHPQLARQLLRTLSLYIRRMDESFTEAAFADIPARVARKLLELAQAQGEQTPQGIRIRTRLPQRTLAGMVAASRENVNRALRRFIVRGDITQENGYITVVRPAELRKRS